MGRKGTRKKLEKLNIRLTAEITDYLCLFFDFWGIRWPLALPGHVRRYILQYINEITVLLILHGYSPLFWLGNTSIRRGLLTCASHFLLHTRFLRWSVICKLAIKWYLMRMCTSWLCPFMIAETHIAHWYLKFVCWKIASNPSRLELQLKKLALLIDVFDRKI